MSANLETLEMESLGEFEDEWEGEGENEAFLGGLLRGVGSMLGIGGGGGEGEWEDETAHEWEDESAHELLQETGHEHEMEDEAFLGGLLSGVGSALGLGESEWEDEAGHEGELTAEHEQEQFIGRAFRGIRRFAKKNAGLLKQVARIAAPMVATAVGGPLGGMLARTAVQQLGEHEYEMAGEFEHEHEHEHEQEAVHEAFAAMTEHEALAEHMAAVAAGAHSEAEAEAMTGAAVISSLSAADMRALRQVRASLVRGAAVLTRLLRSRRATRPLVRTVPTIVRRTARVLNQQAAAGRPVTRRLAARVMARQTRQVLGSPRVCSAVLVRNVRANHAVARAPQRPVRPSARPSARIVRG